MSTTVGSFISGGVAACGAVLVSHPLETVKIRMQLQGELQEKCPQLRTYNGAIQGVRFILRNEGVKGIYGGLGPGAIYQLFLNGCRLGFYEPLRRPLTKAIYNDSSIQSLGVNIFAGAASGILGAACGSPFFLVKTRLQSRSAAAPQGLQYAYRNAFDGFNQIFSKEGVQGLYRGCGAAVVRTGLGSSVQLPTYFFSKRKLTQLLKMDDGTHLHLASSAVAGVVVCCVMHPADTVMSRLYNQDGRLYSGIFNCLAKTVRAEGVWAVYKGFMPLLARILPHTVLTLTLAEQTIKVVRRVEQLIIF